LISSKIFEERRKKEEGRRKKKEERRKKKIILEFYRPKSWVEVVGNPTYKYPKPSS
jgi:hypothetical protein